MDDFVDRDPYGTIAAQEEYLIAKMSIQNGTVAPYLFFSGQCEEALAFYTKVIGANVTMKMRFNESPDQLPDGMLQAGFENKIMHASMMIGKSLVMCSDGCDDKSKFNGFRLTLTVPTESDCHLAFSALADGGKVDMPLARTFWSPCYGMVTDQFEVGWMVKVAGPQQ